MVKLEIKFLVFQPVFFSILKGFLQLFEAIQFFLLRLTFYFSVSSEVMSQFLLFASYAKNVEI